MSILSAQAEQLANDGLTAPEIEAHLIGQGNPPDKVREVVASLSEWIAHRQASQSEAAAYESGGGGGGGAGAGLFDLGLGAFLLIVGVAGSMSGPKIFIGAMVVGGIRIVTGMMKLGQS